MAKQLFAAAGLSSTFSRAWAATGRVSDFIALKQSCVLFIEVKTARGKQSADQVQFEANIKRYGDEYLLARSIDDVGAAVGDTTRREWSQRKE